MSYVIQIWNPLRVGRAPASLSQVRADLERLQSEPDQEDPRFSVFFEALKKRFPDEATAAQIGDDADVVWHEPKPFPPAGQPWSKPTFGLALSSVFHCLPANPICSLRC